MRTFVILLITVGAGAVALAAASGPDVVVIDHVSHWFGPAEFDHAGHVDVAGALRKRALSVPGVDLRLRRSGRNTALPRKLRLRGSNDVNDDNRGIMVETERLRQKYDGEVKPALIKQFGYASPMAAPTG